MFCICFNTTLASVSLFIFFQKSQAGKDISHNINVKCILTYGAHC